MDEHWIYLSLNNEQLYKTSNTDRAPSGIVKSRHHFASGGRMQISKTEKILIILFFAATWAVLALNAGGPIFSDEFLYIDAGLRNFAEPRLRQPPLSYLPAKAFHGAGADAASGSEGLLGIPDRCHGSAGLLLTREPFSGRVHRFMACWHWRSFFLIR